MFFLSEIPLFITSINWNSFFDLVWLPLDIDMCYMTSLLLRVQHMQSIHKMVVILFP